MEGTSWVVGFVLGLIAPSYRATFGTMAPAPLHGSKHRPHGVRFIYGAEVPPSQFLKLGAEHIALDQAGRLVTWSPGIFSAAILALHA